MNGKTEQEISLIRESALLVSKTLSEIAKVLKPGMTTLQVDKLAAEVIRDNGGVPSFLNYNGFPYNICASVNDVVVHGLPNNTAIRDGDIVSLDVGVYKNGYHGDHAYTFIIGEAPKEHIQLVKVTKESLYLGIEKAVAGNRVGDIGYAIQRHSESYGYGVVRELVGHGLGKQMHEKPDVPNYGFRGRGKKLEENMVLAIEPMINLGTAGVLFESDGWTVRTRDRKPSVHFEHDVCVKKGKAMILSDYAIIEQSESKNTNLNTSYYDR
ncbi:type I methionyl aminopeptidase [Olivibacter sitiensis]|uniref:type I methionyl aminopeptidase n=1 Tax=Olivibacter sitiensis TaxID=376470 RepID=UPI000423944E|nr:type I methionyl aminopeptidase [Olivibacter sitiensis]